MSTTSYRENSIKRNPSSNFLRELNPQTYGLTPTGIEDTPRKQYRFINPDGRLAVANFLGLDESILIKTDTIFFTPITLEDFLIFQAFVLNDNYFVIAIRAEDGTTLYRSDVINDEIKNLIIDTNATLYANPHLI